MSERTYPKKENCIHPNDCDDEVVETVVNAACDVAEVDEVNAPVVLGLRFRTGDICSATLTLNTLARRRELYRESLQLGANHLKEDVEAVNRAIAAIVDVAGGVPDAVDSEDVDRALDIAERNGWLA